MSWAVVIATFLLAAAGLVLGLVKDDTLYTINAIELILIGRLAVAMSRLRERVTSTEAKIEGLLTGRAEHEQRIEQVERHPRGD